MLRATIAAVLIIPLVLASAHGQVPALRAFTGATLIDGTTRAPVPNATILVRDGRVVAAGPAGMVRIPVGARMVSLTGKTGQGSESFGTVNPLQRLREQGAGPTRVRWAAAIGRYTQAVDNLWMTTGQPSGRA